MSSTALMQPPAADAPDPAPSTRARRRRVDPVWAIVGAITLAGGLLRFWHLGAVVGDPFYDAAVRSMGLSWHNFFFGAMEPGGSVSIDKPPVDLWLQVLSVKLFGLHSTSLKLPEALAGTLAIPLLFVTVRRVFGVVAGVAAAAALAVLPIDVLTSRSDTMDAVMMLLIVAALWLVVRAAETGETRWLVAAAVALGIAFNVKLFESIVALPGLLLICWLGLPAPRRRRVAQLAIAGAVYAAVSLSWLTATLLFPAHDRPFAIGSTNGSAWNAAFVFNGTDRLFGKATGGEQNAPPGTFYPTATQADRDAVPITPPSPTRLLVRVGPLPGQRLGFEVLAGLLLGGAALADILGLGAWWRRRRSGATAPDFDGARAGPPLADPQAAPLPGATATRRVLRATAIGLGAWFLIGIVLFSAMARLHPRYTEAFTPAVAAVLGIGVAWATAKRTQTRLAALAITLAACVIYGERVSYGTTGTWWLTALAALIALALAVRGLARVPRASPGAATASTSAPATLAVASLGAVVLVALLAIPLRSAVQTNSANLSDAGHVGVSDPSELSHLSAYLRAHQGSARYEVAAASATAVGSLIVRDGRPVVVLTTYDALPLTSVEKLKQLIASGQVRYAWLNTICGPHTARTDAACSAPAVWVREHGVDVSRAAGLPHRLALWYLPRSSA